MAWMRFAGREPSDVAPRIVFRSVERDGRQRELDLFCEPQAWPSLHGCCCPCVTSWAHDELLLLVLGLDWKLLNQIAGVETLASSTSFTFSSGRRSGDCRIWKTCAIIINVYKSLMGRCPLHKAESQCSGNLLRLTKAACKVPNKATNVRSYLHDIHLQQRAK